MTPGSAADTAALMTRLGQHRLLGSVPVAEHAWLVEHGELRTRPVGALITKKGEQATDMVVLLAGHVVIRVDRGAGLHKVFEWQAGDVGGALPYSRSASPPGDAVVEAPAEMLSIPRELFPEMIGACPATTALLVHAMVDRARQFTSSDLRDEKLVSLGKLAAGLAHELNNPASAVLRGAKLLTESIDASEAAARALGAARLSDAQLAMIDEIRAMCLKVAPTVTRSAIGRSDREDEFAEWLLDHDCDERCAGPLAETGVTFEAVDALAAAVDRSVLNATIKWMASGCSVRALSSDIETAATRIHELVGAVKGFTYMDHAPTPEPVDIRQGISDTLTMLGAKIRQKVVSIELDMADDLPSASAVGAELNQVWMNLIDNALDAVGVNGTVTITATADAGRVVATITDNGPGIPRDIMGRIFDPFFTTKGVGKGTGLGLDIVRRLLQQHDGEIAVESAPGRTAFQVRLPRAQ
jgi:signal transduction histidine kinase